MRMGRGRIAMSDLREKELLELVARLNSEVFELAELDEPDLSFQYITDGLSWEVMLGQRSLCSSEDPKFVHGEDDGPMDLETVIRRGVDEFRKKIDRLALAVGLEGRTP